MDPGMPMMSDPLGGAPAMSSAPPPQIDPAKLRMIQQLMMQRQGAGGPMPGPMYPAPPMLGSPPRPGNPTIYPGVPAFGGVRG